MNLILFLLSCAHTPPPSMLMLQAHSSIMVGESGLFCDKTNPQDCQVVFAASKGTATRIRWNKNYYWLTAGHVCNRIVTNKPETVNKVVFIDVGGTGKREMPSVMRYDEEKDLCILPADKGPYRQISFAMPQNGEEVSSIAYPGGVFFKDIKPVYEGRWAGVAEGKCIVTVPVAPGSSGAAILDKTGKVVSVISAVMESFNHFTLTTCLADVRGFLKQSTPLPTASNQ